VGVGVGVGVGVVVGVGVGVVWVWVRVCLCRTHLCSHESCVSVAHTFAPLLNCLTVSQYSGVSVTFVGSRFAVACMSI
jgi:hypothetical protein